MMPGMNASYVSVASGIEAASYAWKSLGWQALAFSEIEPFPSAVLATRFPGVPNVGDMLTANFQGLRGQADLLVGGTPCQSFSWGGRREGLSDARGNLTLRFCEIADDIDPTGIVWENVPGVLDSKDNAFGCFVAALAGHDAPIALPSAYGGRWPDEGVVAGPKRTLAWRTLDAREFGLPQRRRRVFVVGFDNRTGACPQRVLFERPLLPGNTSPVVRKVLEGSADAVDSASPHDGGAATVTWWNGDSVSQTLDAVLYKKQALPEKNRFPALMVPAWERCGNCEDFWCNLHHSHAADCPCPSIETWQSAGIDPYSPCVLRYITPSEGERLQGFRGNWTDISVRSGKKVKKAPDSARYKAVGNSMPTAIMRWIGEGIDAELSAVQPISSVA
jgi:site-specific DNA-cytosine methylase